MFRHSFEKFLYQTTAGKTIEIGIGAISLLSSIIFIVTTYFPEGGDCWLSPYTCDLCKVEKQKFLNVTELEDDKLITSEEWLQ